MNGSVHGLRGNGILRWLAAPFRLSIALFQVMIILSESAPDRAGNGDSYPVGRPDGQR